MADLNVKWFGAKGDGTTDDTASFVAAILAAGSNSHISIPPGNYLITDTLTISNNRVHISGTGAHAPQITFNPTSAKPLFSYQAPAAAILYQCSLRHLALIGAGVVQKIGVRLTDTSEFILEDLDVFSWTGNNSIGVQLRGRELTTLKNIGIAADSPISIEDNPNSTIDCDHLNITDSYLLTQVSTGAAITIASGVNLTNLTIDGNNAWVQGKYGIYWNDVATAQVSQNVHISGVRTEQLDVTGTSFYIAHNFTLQNLVLSSVQLDPNANGIYLRKCAYTSFYNVFFPQTAKEQLNLDVSDTDTVLWNCFRQSGGTTSVVGQVVLLSSPTPSSGGQPFTIFYQSTSVATATWLSSRLYAVAPAFTQQMVLGAETGIGLGVKGPGPSSVGLHGGVNSDGNVWLQSGNSSGAATAYDISLQAVGGRVCIGSAPQAANATALVEINSTTQGVLPPRMTKAQRDAIVAPVDGLTLYQTNGTVGLKCRVAGAWVSLNTTADP